jgi:ATP-dependent RNA helicase DHX29
VHESVKLEKRYSPSTTTTINLFDERLVPYDLIVRLLERICLEVTEYGVYSAAILIFMPGMGEIRRLNDILTEHPSFGSDDFKIYPLHSTLSSENQGAVFDVPPPNIRKIVIGRCHCTLHSLIVNLQQLRILRRRVLQSRISPA